MPAITAAAAAVDRVQRMMRLLIWSFNLDAVERMGGSNEGHQSTDTS